MSEAIRHIETISEYNEIYGFKTMHPQVAYVEFEKASGAIQGLHAYGFYTLFLKDTKCCVINYGKTQYDFDCETVVAIAPQQVLQYRLVEGVPQRAIGLLFHPDFMRGTHLEKRMRDFTFFSYASNEALHLSEDEVVIVRNCMKSIGLELQHPIDKFSRNLILSNLELLLDYCLRFYERQFITRQEMNITAIARFDELLQAYINAGRTGKEGIPTVRYFANRLCLSPNYFGDMVKAETGKTAQEHIALRLFEYAKRLLRRGELNVKGVAVQTGFQHPQHFARFFKRLAGVTPTEYRKAS